jgi:hypothetical protein
MKGRFLYFTSRVASFNTSYLIPYGFLPVQRNVAMHVIVTQLCLKAEQMKHRSHQTTKAVKSKQYYFA